MNIKNCKTALVDLDEKGRLKISASPVNFSAWIENYGVESDLKQLLISHWVQKDEPLIGNYYLLSSKEIMDWRYQPLALENGLLGIGSCLNGDDIVLDLRKEGPPVGFLSHEEIGDMEPNAQLRDFYVDVEPSFEAFLDKLVRKGDLPMDYWEAKERLGGD